MAKFNVSIKSYSAFKKAVNGKEFDVDGCYNGQCWDGMDLVWMQLGRSLLTGGDNARGCWTLKRKENAGKDFDLITKYADLKQGDIVVWGNGEYGHIAMVDFKTSTYISALGQNQKIRRNSRGVIIPGYPFSIVNISKNGFLGAFRLKAWHKAKATEPKKEESKKVTKIKVGDTVIVNGAGTGNSQGGGGKTKSFKNQKMKVISISNGRYGCNQYNKKGAVTGFWTAKQVKKA